MKAFTLVFKFCFMAGIMQSRRPLTGYSAEIYSLSSFALFKHGKSSQRKQQKQGQYYWFCNITFNSIAHLDSTK
jgi:hypothetical protein